MIRERCEMVAGSQLAVAAVPSSAKRLAILPPVGGHFLFRNLSPHTTDADPKWSRIKGTLTYG